MAAQTRQKRKRPAEAGRSWKVWYQLKLEAEYRNNTDLHDLIVIALVIDILGFNTDGQLIDWVIVNASQECINIVIGSCII